MEALGAFKVIGAVAGGIANRNAGKAQAAREASEARLAETQALQRDAQSRDELNRFLSTTNAARSANGLSSLSPNALKLFSTANEVMNNDRLTQSGNDRQRAANLRTASKASSRGANLSLLTGVAKGGVALYEMLA